LPTSQAQQTYQWTGADDEVFGNTLNWDPNGLPSSADTAVFGIGGNVLFDDNFTNNAFQHTGGNTVFLPRGGNRTYSLLGDSSVSGGSLTINPLDGFNLNLNLGGLLSISGDSLFTVNSGKITHSNSLRVGRNTDGSMVLQGVNTLYENTATGNSQIGWGNGFGWLTVQDQATAIFDGGLRIGGGSSVGGQLNVLSGGSVTMGNTNVGDGSNVNPAASVTVSGAGSSITQTGASTLSLGKASGGSATVAVNQGGSYTTGTGTTTVRGTGTLNVGDGSSRGTFTARGHVVVDGGTMNLSNSNSVFTAPELTISGGQVTRNSGSLTLSSIVNTTTNSLTIGRDGGSGALTINGGGVLDNTGSGNVIIGSQSNSTGTATVSDGGSQWNNTFNMFVGNFGAGTLTIENGGLVSNQNGTLGNQAAGVGTVTVNGSGSHWSNSINVNVGGSGLGTLNIENGGLVSSWSGFIGIGNTSVGSVTVTGNDSQWNNTDYLLVGINGTGSLSITDGGVVTSQALSTDFAGVIGRNSGGVGVVNVSGMGSQWDNSGDLSVGEFGQGTLSIENGGWVGNTRGWIGLADVGVGTVTVSGSGSQWNNSGFLMVGYSGQGTLNILDGGQVTATSAYIGFDSPSVGEVVVSGSDSQWNNTSNMFVGNSGEGTMILESGGLVSNAAGTIGNQGTGVGTVIVSGNGSHWNNSADVRVGNLGHGTLNIESGGLVSNVQGFIGHGSGSVGTVTVSGADSTWTNGGELSVGNSGAGTLNIADGGVVENTWGFIARETDSQGEVTVTGVGSTWTHSGELYVALNGTGTLTIADGGSVASTAGYLGGTATATGTATVTGAGSQWNTPFLSVGYVGLGTLNIEDGGVVTANEGRIGHQSSSQGWATVSGIGSQLNIANNLEIGSGGVGVLNIENGGAVSVDTVVTGEGSTGMISVTGGGSLDAFGLYLGVFNGSSGTLTIEDGGNVSSFFGVLATEGGAMGQATVSGAGSQWDLSDALTVGSRGQGTLTIEDSGVVDSSFGFIGRFANGQGAATVTGSGSQWNMTNGLEVGIQGVGTLNIENGGVVSTAGGSTFVAVDTGSAGTISVKGSGSQFNTSGTMLVGWFGFGTLAIEDGGVATSSGGVLGDVFGSVGQATITGIGSQWHNSSDMLVGWSGTGTIHIEDGGFVSNQTAHVGIGSDSQGEVVVTGADSLWDIQRDLFLAINGQGDLTIGLGGTVQVAEAMSMGAQGTLNMFGGTLHLEGHDYQRDSDATVNFLSGTLRLGGDRTLGMDAAAAHLFGTAANITTAKRLQVDGTATLLAPVEINGGTFTVGNLVNAPSMSLNTGTFNLTAADLTVGSGGMFGDSLQLGANQTINVSQAVQVATDGLLSIGSGGRFTGDTLANYGEVLMGGNTARLATVANTFTNHGLLSGAGRIDGGFVNAAGGIVELESDKRLTFTSDIENLDGGRIIGRGKLVAPTVHNYGEMLFSGGFTDIQAPIIGYADSQLIVTGGNTTTILGDVEIMGGAELRISEASSAVFFDHVQLRNGALLTGDGTAYFEGSLGIGNSPSRQEFNFNVTLGPLSNLIVEIGGTDPIPPEYDQYVFLKNLTLQGGALTIDLIGLNSGDPNFMPQYGDSFTIIEVYGNWSGQFGGYHLPTLDSGHSWDLSQLYSHGTISVVPEPSGLLLVILAIGLMGVERRRKV